VNPHGGAGYIGDDASKYILGSSGDCRCEQNLTLGFRPIAKSAG
jgi:hypothetical protein